MRVWIRGVCASLVAAVLLSGTAALTGCNTASGVGKDVEKAGEKLQDAAD